MFTNTFFSRPLVYIAFMAVAIVPGLAHAAPQAATKQMVIGPDGQTAPGPLGWRVGIVDHTTASLPMFTPSEGAIIPDQDGMGFIQADHQRLYVKEARVSQTAQGERVKFNTGSIRVEDTAVFHIGTGKDGDCAPGSLTALISGQLLDLVTVGSGKTAHQKPLVNAATNTMTCLTPNGAGKAVATVTVGPKGKEHVLTITATRIVPKFTDGRADLSAAVVDTEINGGVPGFIIKAQMKAAEQREALEKQAEQAEQDLLKPPAPSDAKSGQ
ncbi:hypothetical protein E3E12_02395 [Formicincola oecophyllae]|uniref:Uncharacterized protein n=1 Tax=Formicincola oecophyllae TaxID=2558361 RepID=A0A4Y6U8D8_9PROT|nr:hypothetical protein [Formicincola oecophyllae]QDH13240.1 hypothetical protein E3E12_02395 [Formicincola oecophyllae]